ncbi:hypothetical protein E3N88_01785 [Mikania micrantha]|uniref:Uncharacterized protein n=1 Tax=Mikania micrantha TaxID=192012 RepID=A0A5N6Q232_9ASTR|nr:hypothetical protein E3N88_01785 [Mikania micrantha]
MPLFDSSSYRPSAAAAYAYQKGDDLAKGPSRIIQEISFINSGAASKFQKSVLVPKLNKAPKIDIGSKVSELKAKA